MTNTNQPWRFYGRDQEVNNLVNRIQKSFCVGTSIIGRRWVGKTELVNEAIDRIRSLPSGQGKPIIYMEIPVISPRLGETLDETIREGGLAEYMSDFGPRPESSHLFFVRQIDHLNKKGAVVVLDEFHNVENYTSQTHLVSDIKLIQDRNLSSRTEYTGGGMVVAGSHQQNMLRILGDSREPLFNRFPHGITLQQLTIEPLLEMAAEQGWLRDPRQFLTLYSAFGGVPGLWYTYKAVETADNELVLEAPDLYDVWRSNFWRYESLRPILNKRASYDYKGLVELNKTARRILQTIIEGSPAGTPRTNLFNHPGQIAEVGQEEWKDSVEWAIRILEEHLHMVQGIRHLDQKDKKNPGKYRIVDNDTRHQLLVQHHNLEQDVLKERLSDHYHQMMNDTTGHEGFDLERIVSEYFRAIHKKENEHLGCLVKYGVQLEAGPEIDALAEIGDPTSGKITALMMGSCKRDPLRHSKDHSPKAVFESWLRARYEDQEKKRPESIRQFVASPVFSEEQHRKWQARGFETLDLPTMARNLGFDPSPNAEPDTTPDKGPDNDYTPPVPEPPKPSLPSFDM